MLWLSGLVALSSAHASPIEPQTLWWLTRRAQLVVLAEVTSIGIAPGLKQQQEHTGIPSSPEALARLRVLEVWKGPKLAQVEVRFEEGVFCPAPPKYRQGERVIAFLVEEEGQWYTAGLSYGAR